MSTFDYILVGGGLQNGLVALALRHFQPRASVLILEAHARLGGNHTWCCHAGDVSARAQLVVEPLVVATWPGYSVKFPKRERFVAEPYFAVSSARMHDVVMSRASESASPLVVRLDEPVQSVEPTVVETRSGMRFSAPVIVDSRGPELFDGSMTIGYQKFVGLECLVEPSPTFLGPILMDATVEQLDGYRFFYALPLEPTRVLIEDTYYSDSPALDVAAKRRGILQYAGDLGLRVHTVVREESGVLPLPSRMPLRRTIDPAHLQGGYAGGWFHPTTGYSFPIALRLAEMIATHSSAELPETLQQLSSALGSQQRYCLLLNRLLFDGFEPNDRVSVFERFYGMPSRTIRNFYALEMQTQDRLRVLCGRPPSGMRPRRLFSRVIESRARNIAHGARS